MGVAVGSTGGSPAEPAISKCVYLIGFSDFNPFWKGKNKIIKKRE